MKKIKTIICTLILTMIVSTMIVSAGGTSADEFSLKSSYPENGQHDFQPVNVAIKLTFNKNVISEEAQKANKGKIKLVDKKGKSISVMQICSKKYPNEIWVYAKKDLKSKKEYKVIISKDLVASDGDKLGKKETIGFGIMDMEKSTSVYMIMMIVMVLFMVVFSSWETKRKIKKEAEEAGKTGKVNPYKVAKATGKSVEAIVSEDKQQKQKQGEKQSKQKQKHEQKKAQDKAAKAKKYEEEKRRAEQIKRQNEIELENKKNAKKRRYQEEKKERVYISEPKKVGKPRKVKYKR